MIYTPVQRALEVQLGGMTGPRVRVEWFDPATGRRVSGGTLAAEGPAWLTPPFADDAVLVLTTAP